jgi:hypothetical protein
MKEIKKAVNESNEINLKHKNKFTWWIIKEKGKVKYLYGKNF